MNYFWNLNKITVMSLSIVAAFIPGYEQVSACRENGYIKVSNLYKWRKWTLHIIFFFLFRQLNLSPDFRNHTQLNGLVNFFC